MAIDLRKPGKGLIVHSDRGSQYASQMHRDLLEKHGFIQSMSGKGNGWDNAVMERFFLNLKMERLWHRRYANPLEATQDISHYIVSFHNFNLLIFIYFIRDCLILGRFLGKVGALACVIFRLLR